MRLVRQGVYRRRILPIIYIVWVRHFESKKVLIVGMLLLTFRYIMEAGFYADFDNKIGISTKTYKHNIQ